MATENQGEKRVNGRTRSADGGHIALQPPHQSLRCVRPLCVHPRGQALAKPLKLFSLGAAQGVSKPRTLRNVQRVVVGQYAFVYARLCEWHRIRKQGMLEGGPRLAGTRQGGTQHLVRG